MQPQFPPIVYLICPVVSRYCDHYASIEFNLLISRVVAFAWWPIISPHGRMEGARSDGEGGTGRAPKIEYFGEKAWWKSSVEMERYASFRRNCFWPAFSKRNRLLPFSLPSVNEISRDAICLFIESLFPACTYARIRCKRLVQRT